MRKINILKLMFLLYCMQVSSQSIERQIIGSAGTTLSYSNLTLDFTVGEVAITTITDGTRTINQGFHQKQIKLELLFNPVVFLQGALFNPNTGEEALMRDDLREELSLPLTSPYIDALVADASVFNTGGSSGTGSIDDDIVDWVFVELRDANDNTLVVASKSALLQRDGNVVDVDGVSNLLFYKRSQDYYVAIHHRNHLAVMTSNLVSLSESLTTIDFTDANNQITFGSNAQTTFSMPTGKVAMWSGNVNGDINIQYSGTTPDSSIILSEVLNDAGNFLNFPTYVVEGYSNSDVNMDNKIQYTGTTPDTPYLLQNILFHPTNFLNFSTYQIKEQLPEN